MGCVGVCIISAHPTSSCFFFIIYLLLSLNRVYSCFLPGFPSAFVPPWISSRPRCSSASSSSSSRPSSPPERTPDWEKRGGGSGGGGEFIIEPISYLSPLNYDGLRPQLLLAERPGRGVEVAAAGDGGQGQVGGGETAAESVNERFEGARLVWLWPSVSSFDLPRRDGGVAGVVVGGAGDLLRGAAAAAVSGAAAGVDGGFGEAAKVLPS